MTVISSVRTGTGCLNNILREKIRTSPLTLYAAFSVLSICWQKTFQQQMTRRTNLHFFPKRNKCCASLAKFPVQSQSHSCKPCELDWKQAKMFLTECLHYLSICPRELISKQFSSANSIALESERNTSLHLKDDVASLIKQTLQLNDVWLFACAVQHWEAKKEGKRTSKKCNDWRWCQKLSLSYQRVFTHCLKGSSFTGMPSKTPGTKNRISHFYKRLILFCAASLK